MDQNLTQSYVGRRLEETGSISLQRAQEIYATFGWSDQATPNKPMPELCHWCAFSPTVPTDELGTDGHPGKGQFLPDLGLERRMWASGELQFLQPLHVGETLTRRAVIDKIDIKEGTTGRMAFVTVSHEVHGENGLAIQESQSIVYLAMPDRFSPPQKKPMSEETLFFRDYAMPSTRLFRFSAITFNAHRIHFDLSYAQDVEKYPGLVVHGPMQAMLCAKSAAQHFDKPLKSFRFRGVHPCFHFDPLRVCAAQSQNDKELALFAGVPRGHQTMQAHATA